MRKAESVLLFKDRLLSFIRAVQRRIYNTFDPKRLKFLTRLRLGFSQLNQHKFRHIFQDSLIPYVFVV